MVETFKFGALQRLQDGLVRQGVAVAADFAFHRHAVLEGVFGQQLAAERVDRADRHLVEVCGELAGLVQSLANAVLQFACGLLGERNEEDARRIVFLFLHELQHNALKCVRLTRAGRSLDQGIMLIFKLIPHVLRIRQTIVIGHLTPPPFLAAGPLWFQSSATCANSRNVS